LHVQDGIQLARASSRRSLSERFSRPFNQFVRDHAAIISHDDPLDKLIEGRGGYTVVNGKRVPMFPGDFVLSPTGRGTPRTTTPNVIMLASELCMPPGPGAGIRYSPDSRIASRFCCSSYSMLPTANIGSGGGATGCAGGSGASAAFGRSRLWQDPQRCGVCSRRIAPHWPGDGHSCRILACTAPAHIIDRDDTGNGAG
jgi:hypothetical protein